MSNVQPSTVIYLQSGLNPHQRRVEKHTGTIAELAPAWQIPFVAFVDGQPVLRADWQRVIQPDQTLAFIEAAALPQGGGGGGGGSDPMRTVLMLAVAVYAPYAASSLLGIGGAAALGSAGVAAFTAGVTMVGMALVNAIVPPPKPTSPQQAASMAAGSPTYSLQAQGNVARLEAAIPEHFGRHIAFPDFAAQPYTEYAGNEQYLYQLLCVGRGEYDITDLKIEDTPLDSFNEISFEIVPPGQVLDLFPSDVISSIEVAGQTLDAGAYVGPFVASGAGTQANYLGLDFVAPKGLYYANNDGSLSGMTVTIVVEAREIDDTGTAIGSWRVLSQEDNYTPWGDWTDYTNEALRVYTYAGSAPNQYATSWVQNFPANTPTVQYRSQAQLGQQNTGAQVRRRAANAGVDAFSAATNTAQRYSRRYPVPAGRYQVRVRRQDTEQTSTRYGHTLLWAGMRAYLKDSVKTYGDVTLIGMRMRASDNLSGQASRKVNLIATRKLPVWNGTSWSANTATRSPAWALAYAAKQVGQTDAGIDLAGLLALNATCTARGDTFDARFDNFLSFWEAATRIVGAVRAKPFMQGGLLRVVRDQAATIPVALFSQRNIVKGSFSLSYIMPTEDTADSVDVTYFDSVRWAPDKVRAKLADSTAAKPAKVDLFGVVTRAQAYREGMYLAATNRLRRTLIRFKTDMEGFIPSVGDLIAVQHDMPNWGQSGDVVAYTPATRTARLSEPVIFTTGNHYLGFRRADGTLAGPYLVTAGADAYSVVFDAGVTPETPLTGLGRERAHFAFGPGDTWRRRAIVVSVRPESLNQVAIEAINEDAAVHGADSGGIVPPSSTPTLPKPTIVPTLEGLAVRPSPFNPGKMIASWQPSPWATAYTAQLSADGVYWQRIGETGGNTLTFDAPGVSFQMRVAALGSAQGPWSLLTVTVQPPPSVVNLAQEGVFDTDAARVRWDASAGAASYTVQVISGGLVRRTVTTADTRYSYTAADAQSDGGLARVLRFDVTANGLAGAAVAATITLTNAQLDAPTNARVDVGFGSLTVRSDTPTDSDYKGTLIWQGTASGFARNSGSLVYDGPGAQFSVRTTPGETVWFAMAHYDVFGQDALNYSGYFSSESLALGGIPATDTTPGTTYLGTNVILSNATDSLYTWNAAALPVPTYERATPQVVAQQITSIDLKAVSASIGELLLGRMVMDAFGYIRGGQTDFNTGAGYWLGYDDDNKYKFSVGNENDDRFYFDQTGGHFAGQLTVESAIQVPIAINGAFDSLIGWYTYNSGTDVFTPAAPAAGTSIVNDAGNNQLSGTSFTIYSEKFPVESGQTYTFAMRFIFNNTNGIAQNISIDAHHAFTPTHPHPAVDSSYGENIYAATRSTAETDTPQWISIASSFVARPGATWASIRIQVY